MTPSYCAVCGRCFQNQYFHIQEGGRLVHFSDFDDSAAKRGYCPGVVGAAWICEEHLSIALECIDLPVETAIAELRRQIGVQRYSVTEGRDEPHLFIDRIGPNRPKVFAILRAATQMTPTQAKEAIEHLPVFVSKGWPAEFMNWKKQLEECGATMRIAWD
ncbi:ribosomal protein L7/L12 [Stieleria maiorica]|nr:ribosomal protein L7/L12 [Stieleria maiorica]